MSMYVHKSHNVTVLLYHLVFPAKYRRAVIDVSVDRALREVCLEIETRYQLKFLEIGTDRDHVHFLVQSVPTYSVTKLVTTIKSLTAREIFRRCPQVKKELWGGEFWTDGYFASTVGRHANEAMISDYVKKQGQEYQKLQSSLSGAVSSCEIVQGKQQQSTGRQDMVTSSSIMCFGGSAGNGAGDGVSLRPGTISNGGNHVGTSQAAARGTGRPACSLRRGVGAREVASERVNGRVQQSHV